MRTARGFRLTVDATRGRVLLTMPHRHSARAAVAWVEARRPWVEALLADAPPGRPFVPDAVLVVDDAQLTIDWRQGGPRGAIVTDGRLMCGGPRERLGNRVETWLRREALAFLKADTADFAARAGVTVSRVTVGDARRRWGSCSASGAIAYSWRLVLSPRYVRRAIAAHEVAHRLHMDHSPDFHAAHARVLGEDPAPARRWLRRHGAELHLFGRGGDAG